MINMMVKLIKSILIPTIICILLSYMLDKKHIATYPAYLMPLFFGIVLGLFNYKYYRHKIYFNQPVQVILISIAISFFCFIFAVFSYPLITNVIGFLFERLPITFGKEAISRLSIYFAMYLVAPFTVLFSFKCVFLFPKGKTTNILIITTLIVFVSLGYIIYIEIVGDKLNLLWMPLMALSLQLIIYQSELKALFKPNTK